MKARELVYYVRSRKIHQHPFSKSFKFRILPEEKKTCRSTTRIPSDFEDMNLGWIEEEYMDIVELLSMPGRIVGDPRKQQQK